MKQVLIAIDQLANAIIGGWADETLSSRAWREDRRRLVVVIDCIFFWEKKPQRGQLHQRAQAAATATGVPYLAVEWLGASA